MSATVRLESSGEAAPIQELRPREAWRAETGLYISIDGQAAEGPFEEKKLTALWKHGKIPSTSLACWEGEDRWWPIADARHHIGFTDTERDRIGIALIFGVAGLFLLFIYWPAALVLLAIGGGLGLWIRQGVKAVPTVDVSD